MIGARRPVPRTPPKEYPVPSFYSTVRRVARPLALAYWRPRITGLEHLPETGAFLVASNHLALIDSFVIPLVAPRQVRFIARADLWQRRGLVGWLMRQFFTVIGTVPVERGTVRSAQDSLDIALQVLRAGDGFGIYPEGTRSRDGRLYKGRTGAAWLAQESGAPVIPVGLRGTDRIFVKGKRLPRRPRLSIAVGPPVDFSGIDPTLSQGVRRREMTRLIMDAIAGLSGQERVDRLNTTASEEGSA